MARCKCLIPFLLTLVFAARSFSTQQESLTSLKKQVANNNAQISLLVAMVTNLQNLLFSPPRNCAELQTRGHNKSGVRTVYPFTCCKDKAVTVFCDQTTDGGGWTVVQRRDALPHREDFFRGWRDYQTGFGDVSGEFWLGLDNIHALVNATPSELYVSLEDFEGDQRWAKYDTFSIEDADGKYRLRVGGYSGNDGGYSNRTGDALKYHDGMMFSTKDQDNDEDDALNCAEYSRGAWWYKTCHNSNLNGFPFEGKHDSYYDGINWYQFRGASYSLKKTEMKVRPKL